MSLFLSVLREPVDPPPFDYKYIISNGSSIAAFRTRAGFKRWLDATGLKLGMRYKRLVELKGYYVARNVEDEGLFSTLRASRKLRETPWLDNGEYTIGLVKNTTRGNIIYFLNPNCNRKIIPKEEIQD